MKLVILAVAAFASGCSSRAKHERQQLEETVEILPRGDHYTISHYMTEIVLTEQQPRNEQFGFALKRIEEDGRVTILVLATQVESVARVGEYFVSEEFGLHGLELEAVDLDARSATFARRWAEHTEEKNDTKPNKPVQSNSVDAPRKSGAVTAISRLPRSV